jgi:hypothetical protein
LNAEHAANSACRLAAGDIPEADHHFVAAAGGDLLATGREGDDVVWPIIVPRNGERDCTGFDIEKWNAAKRPARRQQGTVGRKLDIGHHRFTR